MIGARQEDEYLNISPIITSICDILVYFHIVYILVERFHAFPILTSDPRCWLEVLQLLLPGVFQVLSQHNILVPAVVLFIRVIVVCLLTTHPLSVLQQSQLVVRQQAFLQLHLKSSQCRSPCQTAGHFSIWKVLLGDNRLLG